MTKVDADALIAAEKLAEAMARGIPVEVAPLAYNPSKSEEEKLARLIASIPQWSAEIDKLRAALIETLEVNRLKILREVDRLRTHTAEFEATIAKLSDALKPAAPRATATQKTAGGEVSQRRSMPWDYQEEPDVKGGVS
jgi:hypothetical protein